MKIIADLHLHSKYSRAVSQKMEPQTIAQWAARKGIDLVGTADWTHPLWLKELEASLEEAGEGVFGLKKWEVGSGKHFAHPISPRFILSTEISSIYSQGGKGRRIHNLVIVPSFATAYQINEELKSRGCNLMSDGRPIIGLSSQQLCQLVWSIDENCLVVPCHAWTPWFSLYGSKSGFDSIDECYGEFSERICAVETGLSSDPAMNWRIKELESRSIVSFSDAHSPQKLGREATVFELEELSFASIRDAIMSRKKWEVGLASPEAMPAARDGNWDIEVRSVIDESKKSKNQKIKKSTSKISHFPHHTSRILFTIEFHPEEGKYHYTGHRNCGIKQAPEETFKKGSICSVCGKPLTVGVMHRVEQLARKEDGGELKILKKKNKAGLVGYYNGNDLSRPPYVMLVPLMEILAESFETSVTSQKIIYEYKKLTENLACEFDILMSVDLEKIGQFTGSRVAEAIAKVRSSNIVVEPGYDGVFGVVKIWINEKEPSFAKASEGKKQMSLF